ncbi:hypothetical protein [Marivita geojedonensis]|uniref:hypothetical protein n=1 Tax=Marivita geojedonensis TaxID=1123756 RepID=UPI000A1FEF06|nr:hypothetical protein [Marivita geojedonensis]PRY80642.1 hypothetical protein CLV76_1034 [Marivita geojedonensis]
MIDHHVEIAERASEFRELFGGQEFLEDSIIEATEQIGRIAALLYGEAAADTALDALVGACLSVTRKGGWRDALQEEANGIYSETPAGALLHDLTAYADYGIVLNLCRTVEQREQVLREQVMLGRELLHLVGALLQEAEKSPLWRIVTKAHARWKLDQGEPLTRDDLVLLSGLAEQSVRNRMAEKNSGIDGTSDHIEADSALRWLSKQKKFVSSLWRYQDDTDVIADLETYVAEPLFVPVAPDKSVFHPGLKKDGAYVVGETGSEREFTDFDEALRALQAMLVPTWRRPTEKGRWTQVRGIDWRRVDREELCEVNA